MPEFEILSEPIDVTSMHRPDTTWCHIDESGHLHQWFAGTMPAVVYDPQTQYITPTLEWVLDYTYFDEDGEEQQIGHLECRYCRAHIIPRYTADTTTQYIPGLKTYLIDGERVSREDFAAAYARQFPA